MIDLVLSIGGKGLESCAGTELFARLTQLRVHKLC